MKNQKFTLTFEDIKSGNEAKSIIRTSEYYLSERDGQFHVQGIRYAMDHHIYLNITHHCIPDYKRDMHKVSFECIIYQIILFSLFFSTQNSLRDENLIH